MNEGDKSGKRKALTVSEWRRLHVGEFSPITLNLDPVAEIRRMRDGGETTKKTTRQTGKRRRPTYLRRIK